MHNRSRRKRRHQSFDDDDDDDGRLEEKSERLVRLEHFFENMLKDNEAKFMQVCMELKTVPRQEPKYLPWTLTFSLPPLFGRRKLQARSRNLRTLFSKFYIFVKCYSIILNENFKP